jgi:hypothetical protein
MYAPNDSLQGSPSFTIKTDKLPDGRFRATCVSRPELAPEEAASEVDAIRGLQVRLQDHIFQGLAPEG